MILLSILIPSLESRAKSLQTLVGSLVKQLNIEGFEVMALPSPISKKGLFVTALKDDYGVEILSYVDNKEISTGEKRNMLLKASEGEYVCFVDDDDEVMPAYIKEFVKGCQMGVDCIGFMGIMTTDKRKPVRWKISKDLTDETVRLFNRNFYNRHTNHLAPVKRSIAIQCGFPDKSNAEDSEYSKRLKESGLLQWEYKTDLFLYHYKFSAFNKSYK